jgi:hypothetical protein
MVARLLIIPIMRSPDAAASTPELRFAATLSHRMIDYVGAAGA